MAGVAQPSAELLRLIEDWRKNDKECDAARNAGWNVRTDMLERRASELVDQVAGFHVESVADVITKLQFCRDVFVGPLDVDDFMYSENGSHLAAFMWDVFRDLDHLENEE